MPKPKLGDVIAVDRGLYLHYGIYAGGSAVIHYASSSGDFGGDICVHETTLGRFLQGGECIVCHFPEQYSRSPKRRRAWFPSILLNVCKPPDINVLDLVDEIASVVDRINYHLYSGEETVEHARSCIGEEDYNLLFNNCEHFAVWCKTGVSESSQVKAVLSLITNTPLSVVRQKRNFLKGE